MVSMNQNKGPRRPSPWEILGIIATIVAIHYYTTGHSLIETVRQALAAIGF